MGKTGIGAVLLAGIVMGAGGAAMAQMPPGSQGGGGGEAGMAQGMEHGMEHGMRPGMMGGGFGHGRFMHHPPKSAVFSISRGDTRVMIKCSDDESTRACVDAAGTLLDKLGGAGATGAAPTR